MIYEACVVYHGKETVYIIQGNTKNRATQRCGSYKVEYSSTLSSELMSWFIQVINISFEIQPDKTLILNDFLSNHQKCHLDLLMSLKFRGKFVIQSDCGHSRLKITSCST